MRIILFTLMSVVCAGAMAATVYKWVDEDGITHFSDQPHENAQKVHIEAPQTYAAPHVPAQAASSVAAPARAAHVYNSCAVATPANDQTFPNATTVSAAVQIDPQPRPGDQVFLLLDGVKVAGFPTAGGQYTFPVDRGSHTLQAVVQDASGQSVCQSVNVVFHVLQPSVQNPKNPIPRH